jgi:hypothetical protein
MKSYNFALGHGVIGCAMDMLKMLATEKLGQVFGKIGRSVVSE